VKLEPFTVAFVDMPLVVLELAALVVLELAALVVAVGPEPLGAEIAPEV
jgi:hypothetical protein